MKEPTGELLELDFYYGERTRRESLRTVAKYCCTHGAMPTGEVLICDNINVGDRFQGIYNNQVKMINVKPNEIDNIFMRNDIDVIKIGLLDAIGIIPSTPEIITYSSISAEAANKDNPSVAIVAEGWEFSTPGHERRAKKSGLKCYRRFVDICRATDPAYAAILNEDSLPCRMDLSLGRGSRCFLNFFVSSKYFTWCQLKQICQAYSEAYIEKIENGIYISTYSLFNPNSQEIVNHKALRLSHSAALIASDIRVSTD